MKKLIITNFLLTIIFSSFSQVKVDTLIIGSKKYPLKKTKIFRVYQTGLIDLPSEYKKFKDYNKKTTVDFKFKSDTTDAISVLEDGSEVWVKKYGSCNNSYSDKYINLFSFADTVKVTYKEFSTLKPYIKTSDSRIYFYSSKISCIYNDTLNEVAHRNMTNGDIFAYWHSYQTLSDSEINKIKQTTFILQDLYYLKKYSTFYLDREFIIIVK